MDTTILQGNYGSLERDIRFVRNNVFVQEQNIPLSLEFDKRDGECHHVVLYYKSNPAGTGRIDKLGKIGRVSVVKFYRGRGFGQKIMFELEKFGSSTGLSEIILHAQQSVVSFYLNLGYLEVGPVFTEADIPHQKMTKALSS